MKISGISLLLSLFYTEAMEHTSEFKTLSDCRSGNRTILEWSEFDDVAVVVLDESSVISQVKLASEEFCIALCHGNRSCAAVQVNTTTDNNAICQLLSYMPSIGKVRNQMDVKLLLKGKRSVYNIDTDVSTQCDGLTHC